MDIIAKVAKRLKLSEGETTKLRSTAVLAGVRSEAGVEAVLAGLRRGAENVASARESVSTLVEYPKAVDECPVCFAGMQPVSLAGSREAFFCPIHNVVMPSIE
jgi:hypothetical protein